MTIDLNPTIGELEKFHLGLVGWQTNDCVSPNAPFARQPLTNKNGLNPVVGLARIGCLLSAPRQRGAVRVAGVRPMAIGPARLLRVQLVSRPGENSVTLESIYYIGQTIAVVSTQTQSA